MKENQFYYLSKPILAVIFCSLFLLLSFLYFHFIYNVLEPYILETSKFYNIIKYALVILLFVIQYFFAIKPAWNISSRKAIVKLHDSYFIIAYSYKKNIKILYSDISKITVENKTIGWLPRSQQAVTEIFYQNGRKLKFTSAYKELNTVKYPYDIEHYSLIKFIRALEDKVNLPHSNYDVAVDLIECANKSWTGKDKDYIKAEKLYMQALKKNPKNYEVLSMYVLLLIELKRYDEADTIYECMYDIDKNTANYAAKYYEEIIDCEERVKYWKSRYK